MQPQNQPNRWVRIEELRRHLDVLRERYGSVPDLSAIERFEEQIARRRSRAEWLRAQVTEMLVEADRLEEECTGYLAGMEALMTDCVDRITRSKREAWSPTPVIGYRMWNVADGRLAGVVQPWPTRTKEATCLNHRPGEDLPHSNGHCGPPPCGVYATKRPETIFEQMTRKRSWAIGLVEMSGKVVEHSKGYRAQRATITAVCAVIDSRRVHLNDPDDIDHLLADPHAVAKEREHPAGSDSLEFIEACRFLSHEARRTSWTSENKSA